MNPLEKRWLGKSGVKLPILGFGGAQLSSEIHPIGDLQAQETLDEAWKIGIRYFDTSPWYGLGLSEHRIGYFLRQQSSDEFLLSTKIGRVLTANVDAKESQKPPFFQAGLPFAHRYDYSHDGVMRSFEDSTQRLGLNQLDFLLIHDLDYVFNETEAEVNARLKELESGWKALEQLKSSGQIRGIGAGINEEKIMLRLLDGFDLDFFLVAGPYTLLDQKTLEYQFPRFEQRNVGVIIGSPFAGGILAAASTNGGSYRGQSAPPEVKDRIRAIDRVCTRNKVSIKAAALQFPLGHTIVTSIIPGVKHPSEVRENVELMKANIPQDFWIELRDEGLIHRDAPVPQG